MDQPQDRLDGRPFQPVAVGACYAQTANDRFGNGATEAVRERERFASFLFTADDETPPNWPGSDSDSDQDFPHASVYRLVPSMQRYRNNLTALSQLYNLYLVAYQGQIFAYVPRSVPKQTIPRHADLRLVPRPSDASHYIGGYQDPARPHTINHMIVGVLGSEEVVVACYDDGDVVAYSTSQIADCIQSRPDMPSAVPPVQKKSCHGPRNKMPTPFFHENVGKSAWGLAVHEKSRLIAVSSNRCEVTVFAFALATSKEKTREPDMCQHCSARCEHAESHVRQRARNWRIVVALGRLADNIPNVCFVDDDNGSADLICAVDIRGAMWLAEIWKPSQAALRIEPSNCVQLGNADAWPAPSRGWGILALPENDFLTVDSVDELLGASTVEMLPNLTLDVEGCMQDIPDNPCLPEPAAATNLSDHGHEQFLFGPGAAQVLSVVLAQPLGADGSGPSDSDESSLEGGEGGAEDGEEADDGEGSNAQLDDDTSEAAAMPGGGVAPGQVQAMQPLAWHQTSAQPPAGAGTLVQNASVLGSGSGWGGSLPAALAGTTSHLPGPWPASGVDASESWAGPDAQAATGTGRQVSPPARLDMVYVPHERLVLAMPRETTRLVGFLTQQTLGNRNRTGDGAVRDKFAKRYRMLRLYEREVELGSLEQRSVGGQEYSVLCPQALSMEERPLSATTKALFRATSRLSMVAHVPEMSLVVVASPMGRVLLVTPTRLATPVDKGKGVLHHGFRVDWVLPRRSDERLFRRTMRPLHGMAVGPVQEMGVQGGRDDASRASAPRRYRLMLHYRSHDILTYEISREEETGKLCIF